MRSDRRCQQKNTGSIYAITARRRRNFIVAAFDIYLAPGFDLDFQYQGQSNLSPIYSASTVSDFTLVGDQRLTSPDYLIHDSSPRPSKKQKVGDALKDTQLGGEAVYQMAAASSVDPADTAATNKPKRVRTGCLTCRERHLKCDEGLPNCQNCRKSSRECKRGVRLNFIDTTVKSRHIIPPTDDWKGTSISQLADSMY